MSSFHALLIFLLNRGLLLLLCGPRVVDCYISSHGKRNNILTEHVHCEQAMNGLSRDSIPTVHIMHKYQHKKKFSCRITGMVLASTASDESGASFIGIGGNGAEDTIRVRIWRELASGKEMTLKQLGVAVGERRIGELKSHLVHVEKQSKTLTNKSIQWRQRRGLCSPEIGNTDESKELRRTNKLRIRMRKGSQNQVFIRLK